MYSNVHNFIMEIYAGFLLKKVDIYSYLLSLIHIWLSAEK